MTQLLARDVANAYLARQLSVIQVMEGPVLADSYDAVHKARVATRRARSALRVWRPLYDAAVVRELRAQLAWYGEQLGGPRDAEVLLAHLADLFADLRHVDDDGQARARVLGELERAHRASHGSLVAAMGSSRYQLLLATLRAFVGDPPVVSDELAAEAMPPLVGRAVARVERIRAKALRLPADEAIMQWHEVRKAAKAVRYALEAMRDGFGEQVEPLVASWKDVTEELGLVQDAAIVREALVPAMRVAALSGEDSAPYEALLEAQEALSAQALEKGQRATAEALDASRDLTDLLD